MNIIKIPRVVKGGGLNPNGFYVDKESLDKLLREYIEEDKCNNISYVYKYKPLDKFDTESMLTCDMSNVCGIITNFDDENIYVKPLEGKEEFFNGECKAYISYTTKVGDSAKTNSGKTIYKAHKLVKIQIKGMGL